MLQPMSDHAPLRATERRTGRATTRRPDARDIESGRLQRGPKEANNDRTRQVERDLTLTQRSVTLSLPRVTTTSVPLRQLASPTIGLTACASGQLLTPAFSHELMLHGQVPALTGHAGHLRGLCLVTHSDLIRLCFFAELIYFNSNFFSFVNVSTAPSVHHHVYVC
jgi:hypothetical protein